ncbi:MAG: hypothetical protein JW808_10985, partial [Victivallales bacterium]|nr:hypothetical protein [Victivallales bacterium]
MKKRTQTEKDAWKLYRDASGCILKIERSGTYWPYEAETCIKKLDKALKLIPEQPTFTLALIRILYQVGKYSRLEKLCQKTSLPGKRGETIREYYVQSLINQDKDEKAKKYLDDLPDQLKKSDIFQYYKARVLYYTRDFSAALEIFSGLLVKRPQEHLVNQL